MKPDRNSLDAAFSSLKSHGATFSDSFSKTLEVRLMREQQKCKSSRRRMIIVGAIIAALLLLGGGVGSYAATDGWNIWPWSINVDQDGTVTNNEGQVVGQSVDNADGTTTTKVHMGEGYIEIKSKESLKGKDLKLFVEP